MPATASEENPVTSPDLQPGQTWSHTFTDNGTLDYHCHPHPWMLARVIGEPSSGREPRNWTIAAMEPKGKEFEEWKWTPSNLTVMVGDTVTWVNDGSVMHKVTETTAEHAEHIGGVDDDHRDAVDNHGDDGHTDSHGGNAPAAPLWTMIVVMALVVAAFSRRRL